MTKKLIDVAIAAPIVPHSLINTLFNAIFITALIMVECRSIFVFFEARKKEAQNPAYPENKAEIVNKGTYFHAPKNSLLNINLDNGLQNSTTKKESETQRIMYISNMLE